MLTTARLPVETLRNFSGSSVCVVMDLVDTATTTPDDEVQIICVNTCREVFRSALAAGCSTVIMACSDAVRDAVGDMQVLHSNLFHMLLT
jgi:hypothetical protein